MLSVFKRICAEEDFQEKVRSRLLPLLCFLFSPASLPFPRSHLSPSLPERPTDTPSPVLQQLDNVRDRVDEIESLHRTSELTVKADNDLGGFLRLRIGNLGKEHELKKEEEDGEEEEKREV